MARLKGKKIGTFANLVYSVTHKNRTFYTK